MENLDHSNDAKLLYKILIYLFHMKANLSLQYGMAYIHVYISFIIFVILISFYLKSKVGVFPLCYITYNHMYCSLRSLW